MPEIIELSSDIGISYNGLDVESCTSLTSISYPNLTSIDPLNIGYGYVWISYNTVLNTVNIPLLQHCSSDLTVNFCDVIPSIAFPEILTVGGQSFFSGNPLCASVDLRKLQTTFGDLAFGVNLPNPASDGLLANIRLDSFVDCGGQLLVTQLASLPSFSAPQFVTASTGVKFQNLAAITSISLPSFVSIDPTIAVFGPFWVKDCPLLTILSTPLANIIAGAITITGNTQLLAVNLPALTLSWGPLTFKDNPACTTIDCHSLLSTGSLYIGVPFGSGAANDGSLTSIDFTSLSQALFIQIQQCDALTSVSFPTLPSCASGINISFNPALTSFSAPFWNPIGAQQVAFIADALDVTSVNNILIQCAASTPGFTGPVSLYGGTNAAPTGAGAAAKATLITNGNAVVTN